jgi:hypothetical protein
MVRAGKELAYISILVISRPFEGRAGAARPSSLQPVRNSSAGSPVRCAWLLPTSKIAQILDRPVTPERSAIAPILADETDKPRSRGASCMYRPRPGGSKLSRTLGQFGSIQVRHRAVSRFDQIGGSNLTMPSTFSDFASEKRSSTPRQQHTCSRLAARKRRSTSAVAVGI